MEAIANDEEAVRQAVLARRNKPVEKKGPALATWSEEANLLAQVVDALHSVQTVLIKANSKAGASVPRPEPTDRPFTLFPRIEAEMRMTKHRTLVSILVREDSSLED